MNPEEIKGACRSCMHRKVCGHLTTYQALFVEMGSGEVVDSPEIYDKEDKNSPIFSKHLECTAYNYQ